MLTIKSFKSKNKMLRVIMILFSLLLSVHCQECYGLAIQGGGSKGAYEAGVLFGLANATNSPFLKYNIVTGISIGALNCALISQYAVGDELSMSIYMVDFWRSLNGSSSIFVDWKGGLIDGLLFQTGLFDDSPSISLGRQWMKTASARNITVGSTNLDLGTFGNFDESLGYALFDGIVASASIPIFFSPHNFQGYTWSDGGAIIGLDVFSAIERCLQITQRQSDIVIDMIYDHTMTLLPNETSFKTLDVFERVLSIMTNDKSIWYTFNAKQAYPDVNYRYIIMPSQPTPSMLNFSKESIDYSLQLGVKDANSILANGSGSTIITELLNTAKIRIIYP